MQEFELGQRARFGKGAGALIRSRAFRLSTSFSLINKGTVTGHAMSTVDDGHRETSENRPDS